MVVRSAGIALIALCVGAFVFDSVRRYPSGTLLAALALLAVPVVLGLLAFVLRRLAARDEAASRERAARRNAGFSR